MCIRDSAYSELVARIRRVLRRQQDQTPVEHLDLGDVTLILRRREAVIRGERVALSITESRFLAALAASMPNAVTTEHLLRSVWADSDSCLFYTSPSPRDRTRTR